VASYRISQLADRVGLRASTLRFYEQEGLLAARRSEAGYRLYDEEAVERLGFVAAGKHLGLPLHEIREVLGVWERGLCIDVRARLRPLLLTHIAEAQQRSLELAAFTDRLREAVAEIDGPSRPGRCDPECGFLHHKHQPVPVGLSPHRPPAVSEPALLACSLTGADRAERIRRWRGLLGDAGRDRIPGGMRVHLPADLVGPVAELAALERDCCPFLEFSLNLDAAGLRFEVRAPIDAAPLLTDVFDT
jgi:DNA-binding transcriptional MerR regulator